VSRESAQDERMKTTQIDYRQEQTQVGGEEKKTSSTIRTLLRHSDYKNKGCLRWRSRLEIGLREPPLERLDGGQPAWSRE